MKDTTWINNPAFKDIDAKKLAVLVELMNNSEGKRMQEIVPVIMAANTKLKSMGMNFTSEETTLLMDLMTKDLKPEEKQMVDKMKTMVMAMSKK